MDREAFAKLALERLERVLPAADLRLQDAEFAIAYRGSGDLEGLVYLANYYAEYEAAAPEAREAVLARLERSAQSVDSKESLDEIRVNLVPRIKPLRLFKIDMVRQIEMLAANTDAKPKKTSFYHRPLAEYLGVGVAIDRPEQVAYIPDPDRYGATGAELASIALENLRRMTKSGLEEVRPGLWRGDWKDDYAVERMLLPKLWDLQLDGAPVVLLCCTEKIYVAGSRDLASLEQLWKIAEERANGPRGFGPLAFVRENDAWSPFEARGALGNKLGTALALHLADTYADQKEALQEEHPDLFVASVMGLAADGQLTRTVASWGKDVATLLPRTTHVAIAPSMGGDPIIVPWEEMVAVVGENMKRMPDVYPPRWRVVTFPSDAELDALRAKATDGPKKRGAMTPAEARQRLAAGSHDAAPHARSLRNAWYAAGVLVAVVLAVAYYACGH